MVRAKAPVLILLAALLSLHPMSRPISGRSATPTPGQNRLAPVSSEIQAEGNQDSGKLPGDLIQTIRSNDSDDRTQSVIVQASGTSILNMRRAIEARGGTIRHGFASINSVLVDMPISRIMDLAKDASVRFITPDRYVTGSLDATTRLVGADKLRWPAPSSYGSIYPAADGAGVGIAMIDSGISSTCDDDFRSHASRTSRIVAFENFVDSSGQAGSAHDDYGHGTSVAGVAAGSGWASEQVDAHGVRVYPSNYGNFSGVAPQANLIVLKVLDSEGTGTASAVLKALDYCISNKSQFNIRVINLSLGGPVLQSYKTDPLCLAAESCVANGIVVVCAAGNVGHNDVIVGYDAKGNPIYQTVYGGIVSPGNDPKVITVGATKDPVQTIESWSSNGKGGATLDVSSNPNPLRRSDLNVTQFSSRGPTLVDGIIKPDLVAPGTKIIAAATRNTAYLTDQVLPNALMPRNPLSHGGAPPKCYDQLTGTSFSAPVVTGTVALMLEANPSLSPRTVKAILMITAQQLPSLASKDMIVRLLTEGAGLLNAYASVRLAQNIRPDAGQAGPGQELLKPGVTLNGLSQDLKLVLTDQQGNFLEYAPLNSGIMIADGHLLSDGFILADGHLLADAHLLSDGFLLADGHLLSDGSIWPDGHLLSDSYVQANCLQPLGSKLVALTVPVQNWFQDQTVSFYADGVVASTGNMDGGVIFSPQASAIWSSAMIDPGSMAAAAGAESIVIMGSNDDTPIFGIKLITSSCQLFPRRH